MDDLNMVFWSTFFLMWGTFFVVLLVVCLRLRRRNCPDCGRPFGYQSPLTLTWRQWFEGGYLCQNCGCETNRAGEKVAPGTGPLPGSVVRGLLLVTPLVVAAPILLFFGLRTQEAAPPEAAAPAMVAPPADADES